jgi:hypothetical protein
MAGAVKPAFLLLPREIRDRIYLDVLQRCMRTPPPTPDQAGERRSDSRDSYCPSHVAYELVKLPSIVPSLGLLRCCRQTRSELQELIRREDTNERTRPLYQLDCILAKYRALPTWIALPTSLAHVHRLEINIRVFDMHQEEYDGRQKLLIVFPGIFDLLYRLFNLGPHFYRCHTPAFPVFINTLVLRLVDEFSRRNFRQPQELGSEANSSVDSLPIREEVSFERVWQCISGLARYGLLQGRVHTIRIYFGSDIKVIHVNSSTVTHRARTATSGQWLAWKYVWPRDICAHRLDT